MKKRTVIAPAAIAALIAMQPITLLAAENAQAGEGTSFVDAVRSKVRAMFDENGKSVAPASAEKTAATASAPASQQAGQPASVDTAAAGPKAEAPKAAAAAKANAGNADKVMTYKEAVKEAGKAGADAVKDSVAGAKTAAAAAPKASAEAKSAKSDAESSHWNWGNWGKNPRTAGSQPMDAERAKMKARFEEQRKQYQTEMNARSQADQKRFSEMNSQRMEMRKQAEARYKAEMARRDAEMKKMRAERGSYEKSQKARYEQQKKAYQAEMAKRKAAVKQRAQQEMQKLQAAVKKDPKNPELYGRMGQVMGFMGDREGANRMFDTARLVARERSLEMRLQAMKSEMGRCAPDAHMKSLVDRATKELAATRARIQKLTSGS